MVQASSTDTFGRVMASSRDHHIVVDGPVQNGCPGEELTPGELFLASIACCGVELVQVIGRQMGIEPRAIRTEIAGSLDPANRVRDDVMVFNAVRIAFRIAGVGDEDAAKLVEAFKRR